MNRLNIGQWFCLVAGIALMSFQIYKYFTDRIELNVTEGIVFLVAAVLIFAPKALSEAGKKITENISDKFKKN